VGYYRCGACGFIFTTAFDQFTHEDFAKWIYNEQYALVDPDYAGARAEGNAQFISHLLGGDPANKSLRILDYGGGSGRLSELLRNAGYADTSCYDPFVPASSQRPEGQFDLILCFEVLEHSTDPKKAVSDILSMLREPAAIAVFSTLFQPPEIDQLRVGWWYIAPRNGHVSLFSRASMRALARALKFKFGSFTDGMHVLYRNPPAFAAPWTGT
jgi:2-polyprenyl-6-hydroxyphenyl methylase/3-demethylubiquinone-9 3-methyltransferase